LRSLIIARPAALNIGQLWKIVREIEDNKLKIIGLKEARLDIHFLSSRAKEERHAENSDKFLEGEKVPCVLIAVEGEKAEDVAKQIQDKYSGLVHISLNSEIAKYEIQRFFTSEEIFAFETVENEVFWGKESRQWKRIVNMSVNEVANERKAELAKSK
jgi:hypothetical protein